MLFYDQHFHKQHQPETGKKKIKKKLSNKQPVAEL